MYMKQWPKTRPLLLKPVSSQLMCMNHWPVKISPEACFFTPPCIWSSDRETNSLPLAQASSDQCILCLIELTFNLLLQASSVHCCFTSTETIRTIRDGEPRTATSTFTQLLSSDVPSKGGEVPKSTLRFSSNGLVSFKKPNFIMLNSSFPPT